MKKLPIVLFVSIMLTLSCTNTTNKQSRIDTKKHLIIREYLDKFLSENNDCFDNQIKEEEATKKFTIEFLDKCLGDSIPCISELPLQFEMMVPYKGDKKYVLKFVFSEHLSNIDVSPNYNVMFMVFSIVDKDTAAMLKKGGFYTIKGSCRDYLNKKSFKLPNGDYYEDYPRLFRAGDEQYVSLGSLIVENISFTEI